MSKTALLFAGQGAQSVGMGRDLAQTFPSAQAWIKRANQVLDYNLSGICFTGPEKELTATENAQPGIYLVSWVAFQMLKEQLPGLSFQATAGLSLGEFTALAAADVFTFEDGLKLVRQRGMYMQEACDVTSGGMAAVIGLDEDSTREVCEKTGIEVANLNCPGQIVVSGPSDCIDKACEMAKAKGAKRALPLTVAGAYHSSLMRQAQPLLNTALQAVDFRPPSVSVISNVTALPHDLSSQTNLTNRLVDQVTSPVRWEASMRHLIADGFTRFIELGPGTALSGFMKRIDKTVEMLHVADVPSLEATVRALKG